MDWISIGKTTKTHGLKGELKFYPSIDEAWIIEMKLIRLSFGDPLEDSPKTGPRTSMLRDQLEDMVNSSGSSLEACFETQLETLHLKHTGIFT